MKSNRVFIIIIILLMFILVVSVAINYVLFKQGQGYYHQLNLTRLDPLGSNVYPPESNEIDKSKNQRFVFFGDSRAYQWPSPAELDGYEFINRGIGAQTSSQAIQRFEEHIAPLQPDIVLIQMCINDLKTIPLFPELKSEIVWNCKNNIAWSVEEVLNQEGMVILTTVFPLGELPLERRPFWSEDVAVGIEEVNQFIYSLAGEKVIVFDTGEVLANEAGTVREEYRWDFLHLNEDGYEALNEELTDILADLK